MGARRLFLFSGWAVCLGVLASTLVLTSPGFIWADTAAQPSKSKVAEELYSSDNIKEINADVPGYLARVERDDPKEVERALQKAEQFYLDNNMSPALPVIAFVLHGPEVEIFFRDNYLRYKPIVDLAARLSALKVIDIKICRTRLRHLETDISRLFPFVGSVPFGPAEIERLTVEEGFLYF